MAAALEVFIDGSELVYVTSNLEPTERYAAVAEYTEGSARTPTSNLTESGGYANEPDGLKPGVNGVLEVRMKLDDLVHGGGAGKIRCWLVRPPADMVPRNAVDHEIIELRYTP